MDDRLLEVWRAPEDDEAVEWLAGSCAEEREARYLLTDLLREPVPVRRHRVWSEEKFHTPQLCELLEERSRDLWFSDPAAALEMADLAVTAAERLAPERYGSGVVEDERAMAWGYLSNAFRVSSDLWRAEQALRQAWLHHACAGRDALTEIKLLSFTGSLLDIQGRTDEALRVSDRAIALCREGQDCHLEGAALLKKGMILGDQLRYGEAISALREGLARIEPGEDPRLLLMRTHNMIVYLAVNGAPAEAAKLLERSRFLYQALADPVLVVRLRWLDGYVATRLGRQKEAERAICEARDFYRDRAFGVDFVKISLDLAELYLRERRLELVKKVAAEVIPLSASLGLRQDTFLARLLFEKASRIRALHPSAPAPGRAPSPGSPAP